MSKQMKPESKTLNLTRKAELFDIVITIFEEFMEDSVQKYPI